MGHLIVPNITGKQMGKVITTLTVTNLVDQIMATRGFIPYEQVRSATIDNVAEFGGACLCRAKAQGGISYANLCTVPHVNPDAVGGEC